MTPETIFWIAIAFVFLALSVRAGLSRRAVASLTNPIGALPHVQIAGPVASALRDIMLVELVGFVAAAAGATVSAIV